VKPHPGKPRPSGSQSVRLFDDPERWWFLTRNGFNDFAENPIAQGYEILARHRSFPHIVSGVKRGKPCVAFEQANLDQPRPTWPELSEAAQRSFTLHYKYDMRRMGLLRLAWLGPAAVTFDCTASVYAILAAVDFWLGLSGIFRKIEHSERPWSPRNKIRRIGPELETTTVSLARRGHRVSLYPVGGDPDLVTLMWQELTASAIVGDSIADSAIDGAQLALAALQSYLEGDSDFRTYREERLRLARNRRRLKKTAPESIALGCIEDDWLRAGRSLRDLNAMIRPNLAALVGSRQPQWKNYRRVLKKLHRECRLPSS
jgi:hypothetical protein